MVAEKGQPHPLSAHVKPPAVVLLTARGNQYAARGLWKLLGLSRSYLPRAAFLNSNRQRLYYLPRAAINMPRAVY